MRKIAHAILAFLLVLQGCATLSLPDYPKGTTASYSNAATINDFCVAVKPITKKDDLEKYFGTNLMDLGIIPVYLVSENRNAQISFVISKDRISMISKSDTAASGARPDDSTAGNAVGIAGAATFFLGPITAIGAGIPMMFIGTKMASDAGIIQQNLVKKELQARTISPGKSVDGFVYFKLPEATSVYRLKDWTISIQASELGSDVIRKFTFTAE